MSWYVGQDGRKVWVENSETVYTVGEPEEELPLETLTYLAVNSHKPVFQENIINEDTGKKTKKAKEGAAGRQRGFVVRVEQEDKGRVVATFRAAAEKLLASGIVSRYDVDESSTGSKKKRGKKEEEEEPVLMMQPLGSNECRVETTARCQHNAHGIGFRVEVAEGGAKQRIHMFTANKELSTRDWYKHLVEAIESVGLRVMLGRMNVADGDGPTGAAGIKGEDGGSKGGKAGARAKKDEAREDEDEWLESVLGRCMISNTEKAKPVAGEATEGGGAGSNEAGVVQPNGEGATENAPKKPTKQLPPWLRR
mmetsp:Transcript_105695/g.340900  ORF Transcript_105695/g.340900 Transcript_105695/m.340900 type:complete len:309 (+) Transcript_105695:117-1043(+)